MIPAQLRTCGLAATGETEILEIESQWIASRRDAATKVGGALL
jgi:hypothetical protein